MRRWLYENWFVMVTGVLASAGVVYAAVEMLDSHKAKLACEAAGGHVEVPSQGWFCAGAAGEVP